MTVLDAIREDRVLLAQTLQRHPGIRQRLVEDLYPDKAHFIYELLQNAEDQRATEVCFDLVAGGLRFEHNGTPFNESDIRGITDFGDGSKAAREETIGRFGIGFKAVFSYTNTPRIWSPTFNFEIRDLVVPTELGPDPSIGTRTRFEFPFDNPEKPPSDAAREVLSGLEQLTETTLLFLTNISTIRWRVFGGPSGSVRRLDHGNGHIETQTRRSNQVSTSVHFLRFEQPVEGARGQKAAIAFALEKLPPHSAAAGEDQRGTPYRIVPADPGRVAIYFPADKEVSGLRFHLHAPFIPELSRASVKDTPANDPLFNQLADLCVAALFELKDRGLLDASFLAVLPNSRDTLPARYEGIRDAITDALITKPLTPTHSKGHAPANQLLQAGAALKTLLSDTDLETLIDYDEHPPRWVVNAPQRNSDSDRILSDLGIQIWDVKEFVNLLVRPPKQTFTFVDGVPKWIKDSAIQDWLSGHSDDWHQRLYALLYREHPLKWSPRRFGDARIVLTGKGEYVAGNQCFFPTDGVEVDPLLPRVRLATYTSGRSQAQKDDARRFLEAIGVREVGEAEQVEVILRQRYTGTGAQINRSTHKRDLKRFIALLDADEDKAGMFSHFQVLQLDDGTWGHPREAYLDTPYLATGLGDFYALLGDAAPRRALAPSYATLGIAPTEIARFARSIGANTRLEVSQVSCLSNPDWHTSLRFAPGSNVTSTRVDRDYKILHLESLLENPTIPLARLLWTNLTKLTTHGQYLRATYRKNQSHDSQSAPSQLVHDLRNYAWIPQGEHGFARPAEASQSLLPDDFEFDPNWPWLQAVDFGQDRALKETERQRQLRAARELGIGSAEELSLVKQLVGLANRTDLERLVLQLTEEKRRTFDALPVNEPSRPERRAAKVAAQAADAPERGMQLRTRSVSIARESVKKDTDPYLRAQYTNHDGELICQICKHAMPFRLADGLYYFEAVEFLPSLSRHHYQNYLALCPNHAAMYMYANDAPDHVRRAFENLTENTMEIVLAGEKVTIYFTATHAADLRSVIATDTDT